MKILQQLRVLRLVIKRKALIARRFQNLNPLEAAFFQVISIFWPICKKMLLKKLFADNILSVSQGEPALLDSPIQVDRAESLCGHLSAVFRQGLKPSWLLAGSRVENPWER
jgi:hypothetical protein